MRLICALLLLYPAVGYGDDLAGIHQTSDKGVNAPLYSNGNTLAHRIIEVEENGRKGVQSILRLGVDLGLPNNNGESPFLFGYKHQTGLDAIQDMLNANPKLISVQDNYGRTPLLIALRYRNPLDVVQYTYQQNLNAIRIQDNEDRLPAHYVFRYKTDLDVKKFIVKMHPSALSVIDTHGNTPLDYARKYRKKNPEDPHKNYEIYT